MKILRRLPMVVAMVATLAMFPALPVASAGHNSKHPYLYINKAFAREIEHRCDSQAPYTCTVSPGVLSYTVSVRNRQTPAQPIVVNYRVEEDGATGSVTIPTDVDYVRLNVPVAPYVDPSGTRIIHTRMTSSNPPIAIEPPPAGGEGVVTPGATIPADCTLSAGHLSRALVCTDRPANQQWRLRVACTNPFVTNHVYGNFVTGNNGTSSVDCNDGLTFAIGSEWHTITS